MVRTCSEPDERDEETLRRRRAPPAPRYIPQDPRSMHDTRYQMSFVPTSLYGRLVRYWSLVEEVADVLHEHKKQMKMSKAERDIRARSRGSRCLSTIAAVSSVVLGLHWISMLGSALGVLPGTALLATAPLSFSSPTNAQPVNFNAAAANDERWDPAPGQPDMECPRCDTLFGMLARTAHGTNVQNVQMQVRDGVNILVCVPLKENQEVTDGTSPHSSKSGDRTPWDISVDYSLGQRVSSNCSSQGDYKLNKIGVCSCC